MRKLRVKKICIVPLIGCQTEPVSDMLAGRKTLNLNGSMRRKVHNGKHCVLDVAERGTRAGGADTEEGTILWSEKNTIQDVVVGAES